MDSLQYYFYINCRVRYIPAEREREGGGGGSAGRKRRQPETGATSREPTRIIGYVVPFYLPRPVIS
jgi:hypothetical protein